MKNLSFYGIDFDLEISLMEYGLILSKETHEDGSGTQFAVYKCGEDQNYSPLFGTGHYSEQDTDNLIRGKEWADQEDIAGFLEFIGIPTTEEAREEYIRTTSHAGKLNDLISYFGTENVMGAEYHPMTAKEARKLYLKPSKA
jgi:hypothetical protein